MNADRANLVTSQQQCVSPDRTLHLMGCGSRDQRCVSWAYYMVDGQPDVC